MSWMKVLSLKGKSLFSPAALPPNNHGSLKPRTAFHFCISDASALNRKSDKSDKSESFKRQQFTAAAAAAVTTFER